MSTGYPSAPPSATCSGRAKKSPGPSEEEEEEDEPLAPPPPPPPPPSLNAPPEEAGGGRGGRRPRGESRRWRNQTILNGNKKTLIVGKPFFKTEKSHLQTFPTPASSYPGGGFGGVWRTEEEEEEDLSASLRGMKKPVFSLKSKGKSHQLLNLGYFFPTPWLGSGRGRA